MVLTFFSWLLPLGIFIKPAQEKIACDGQRAVCLCTNTAQARGKNISLEGHSFKNNSKSNKESNASGGGAGHYYLVAHSHAEQALRILNLHDFMLFAYGNPFLRTIDHVPKA